MCSRILSSVSCLGRIDWVGVRFTSGPGRHFCFRIHAVAFVDAMQQIPRRRLDRGLLIVSHTKAIACSWSSTRVSSLCLKSKVCKSRLHICLTAFRTRRLAGHDARMRSDLQRALLECHGGERCEGIDNRKSAEWARVDRRMLLRASVQSMASSPREDNSTRDYSWTGRSSCKHSLNVLSFLLFQPIAKLSK